jgi:hypothetical protein
MKNLEELLTNPAPRGVWTMTAVSKCGTAVKFTKNNGAEIIVTIGKLKQWVQQEKCTIKENTLTWNFEKFETPEF